MPQVPEKRYYDNTRLSDYKKCPRKYQLRHVMGWRSAGTAIPLVFGLSWHAAMEVVWQYAKTTEDKMHLARLALAKFLETWESEGLPTEPTLEQVEYYSPRLPMTAFAMLVEYIEDRWKLLQSCELLANEQPFAVPLPGIDNVWYIGRIDKVARIQGSIKGIEHKTTTSYKVDGGFQYSYIEGWYNDSQTKGYQFGGGLFFPGLTEIWVDAALVHKKVHDKFRFIPIAHQKPLLDEWLDDTRDWVNRVERDQKQGYFPKNEESCMGKYGPCTYLNLCRTQGAPQPDAPPPEGYILERWEPFEVLGLDKLLGQQQEIQHEQALQGNNNDGSTS